MVLIAVEGCCHGELDNIYASIERTAATHGTKVDLLLICGDFQACRNEQDLNCMAVPQKYRTMASFYKYYSGELVAPMLTIFVGGNHEASNHLWELFHGGWVVHSRTHAHTHARTHARCTRAHTPRERERRSRRRRRRRRKERE